MNKEVPPAGSPSSDLGHDFWRSEVPVGTLLADLAADGRLDLSEFRLLADHIPTLCWLANGDGYIVWYNRRWHEYCGSTLEQMEGWGWQSVHDSTRLPQVMERWTASVSSGEPFEMTFPLKGADGVFRPFLTRVHPVRDATGKIARWVGVNTEISAQIEAEVALRESEERQRIVLDAAASNFYSVDREGNTTLATRGFIEMLGFADTEAVIGRKLHDVIHHTHPDGSHYPVEQCPIYRCANTAEPAHVDTEAFYRLDGTPVPVEYWVTPNYRDGEHVGATCTIFDLTERMEAAAERHESEQRFRRIADSSPVIMWVSNADRTRNFVNRAYVEFLGGDYDEALTTDWRGRIHADDQERLVAESIAGEASLKPFTLEGRYRRSDGEYCWLRSISQPKLGANGEPVGFIGVAHDVTETRLAADALRAARDAAAAHSAERETMLTQLAEGVIVTDADGEITFVNDAAERLHGVKLLGVAPDEYSETYSLFTEAGEPYPFRDLPLSRAVLDGETVIDARWRIRRPDGTEVIAIGSAQPIINPDGVRIGGVLTVRDDTARARAEEELRLVNKTLAERVRDAIAERDTIWSVSQELLAVFDTEGRFRTTNPSWQSVLGWAAEDLNGAFYRDFIHDDDVALASAALGQVLDTGRLSGFEARYRRKDGEFRWLAWTAVVEDDLVYATGRDVTEEKLRARELESAQEALRQAQKMEAVGQLTGGIAHDFNNLLTVVTGNIDMAGRALDAAGDPDPRARRLLASAMKGAERAASLTQRLLAFSRRQPLAPKPIDVDKLVVGMADLLNRSLGETVELEIVTSPGLWRVEADPNQLESAILNLAVNARDAMPDGGQLTIETVNARLDEDYAAAQAEVAPGQYVVFAVTDTGQGMSKETSGRVFEPFFTTKEVGKGTGLGLSMVYGFVKQSGGHVKIYSEEGQGTTVKLYLPRMLTETEQVDDTIETDHGIERSTRSETILVVEDDDDVRAYSVECLRELGYRVLEAHDGASALRLLDRQDDRVDLLFTDVVMPQMSGRELVDSARAIQADLRVLYTSGYTRNAIVHGGRLDAGVELIAKPFTFSALARKIRDMLDRGRCRRMLVVSELPDARLHLETLLHDAKLTVELAANQTEALGKVRAAQGKYDAVIIQHDDGDALGAELRALRADLPILLLGRDGAKLPPWAVGDRCAAMLDAATSSTRLVSALERLCARCDIDE